MVTCKPYVVGIDCGGTNTVMGIVDSRGTQHPNFKYTADFDKKYTFDIEKYLNRRMKLKKDEVFDVVEA